MQKLVDSLRAEIVETTLVFSQFGFLRVGSCIFNLRVIILPGTQILKVVSRISDFSWFHFSFLKFYVAPSSITRPGATRSKKKILLGNYPIWNGFCQFSTDFGLFSLIYTEKGLKSTKKVETSLKKSISTSFWVRAAPESWPKYTTDGSTNIPVLSSI